MGRSWSTQSAVLKDCNDPRHLQGSNNNVMDNLLSNIIIFRSVHLNVKKTSV